MFRSVLLSTAAVFMSLSFTCPTRASAAIPSSLRETRALDNELVRLIAETQDAARQLQQLRREVQGLRKDVREARTVVKTIRQMDDRIARLIRQLKPYSSIPKVRTIVKVLTNNLTYLQKSIHTVRVKTDQGEKQVLIPLENRLAKFDSQLQKPLAALAQLTSTAQQTRTALAQAASLASKNNVASRALEASARTVRPSVTSLTDAVAQVNSQTNSVSAQLNSVKNSLAAFWTVRSSLATMNRQLQPGESVANDLDRVMNKRLQIKLPIPPFKRVGFTIRQVLEEPGKVMDIVLKPLEKLADQALQPVINKLNLHVQPPKGLESLTRAMDQIAAAAGNLDRTLTRCESQVTGSWQRKSDQFTRLAQQQVLNRSRSR